MDNLRRFRSLLSLLLIGSVLYTGQVSAEHIHIDHDAFDCTVCLSTDNLQLSISNEISALQTERQYATTFSRTQAAHRSQPATQKHSRAPPAHL